VPLKIPSLQQTTDAAQPNWIGGRIPTRPATETSALAGTGLSSGAYVVPGVNAINVTRPDLYSKPEAAHESTHVFQNGRNDQFQNIEDNLTLPGYSMKMYDYGGVKGLLANPLKTATDYSREQQAKMVEDLTTAQDKLTPKMNPQQLQDWDTTKTALERPIRQLANVPPQDVSLGGRIDHFLDQRGFGAPIARVKGILSTPDMNTVPQPPPDAPSVALGYANRSKLVR
jgi:hypothetical protein